MDLLLRTDDTPPFWSVWVLATALGMGVAFTDEIIISHIGAGPVSHIDECADSAYSLLAHARFLDGSGMGRLDALREVFVGRPNGPRGLMGLFAVVSSIFFVIGNLVHVVWNRMCRIRSAKGKRSKAHADGVPASTTHEKLQMTITQELACYFSYIQIFGVGFFREYMMRTMAVVWGSPFFKNYMQREKWHSGWVDFYVTHGYAWCEECFGRPISSAPDSVVDVVKRKREGGLMFGLLNRLEMTEESIKCINLASYNYLGFGGIDTFCTPRARQAALEYGFSTGGSRSEGGTLEIHRELETMVASFLGKEDAVVMGMGFATNCTILPALFEAKYGGKGILVLSDELNHRSIVEGIRLSGVTVRAFQHNNMVDLEAKLKAAVETGQATGQPWRKVFIVVEGIYSMEGDFCRLREIVTLKNRYKAYLYLDEAHSIGAVGATGRGVTELLGVPSSEVEVMMGTFTKSYGSAGGYVASSKEVIAAIRRNAPGSLYAAAMSAPCAAQALQALKVIEGQEGGSVGAKKLEAIKDNANYFRRRMQEEGFKLLGDFDSPIIPMMVHHAMKGVFFSRLCLEQGLAVVFVGYPVVPIKYERARFCISASHTREQLDKAILKMTDIGRSLGLLYDRGLDRFEVAARAEKDANYSHWLYNAPLESKETVIVAPSAEKWFPEPLVPKLDTIGPVRRFASEAVLNPTKQTPFDFRLFDPLGYAAQPLESAKHAIEETMNVYGFGACGPRGFYGGAIPHLSLEQAIAKFLDVDNAIVYSSAAVTASSVIQSLVQPGDRVLLDADAHIGIRAGVRLSRFSDVGWVNHGDLNSMEAKISGWAKEVNPKGDKERKRRTFLVVEALCSRTGKIAPLADILALKEKYRAYLILDESHSIGTLGANGRGLCEHLGISTRKIDVIVGSLENALANVGGFCAGRYEPVHHQRLAGPGYCYSAASPPCSAAAAIATLVHMSDSTDGAAALERLRGNVAKLHSMLKTITTSSNSLVHLVSDERSYVQHLQWTGPDSDAEAKLVEVAEKCEAASGVKVQVCIPGLCTAEGAFCEKIKAPPFSKPTLRLCARSLHTDDHLAALRKGLVEALKQE